MHSAFLRLCLLIAAVSVFFWQDSTVLSQTPSPSGNSGVHGIFVLDDCDPVFKDKDHYEDNLTFLDASGMVRFRVSGINGCEAVGCHHLIAADAQRQWVWVSEMVANCIRRYDLSGKVTLTIPLKGAGAIALHPESGNLWALVSDKTIHGIKLMVFDEHGQELLTYEDVQGFDIVYDRTENAFWTVSKNVTKIFAADGQVDFSHRVAEWCAVSIDIDPQSGAAWIAVRDHPEVPGSKNQLLKFSRHGKLLTTIELGEKDPFCVSLDPQTGDVWMVNLHKSIERFSSEGVHQFSHPMSALAVLADRSGIEAASAISAAAWVLTETELRKLDAQGKALFKIEHLGKTGQAWLGVLE